MIKLEGGFSPINEGYCPECSNGDHVFCFWHTVSYHDHKELYGIPTCNCGCKLCYECDGNGFVWKWVGHFFWRRLKETPCPNCEGKGVVFDSE